MTLFNDKYRIKSTRLKDWDYSQPGNYYITICSKGFKPLFGSIQNSAVSHTESGTIVINALSTLPKEFPSIQLDEFVVMPDHIHAIINIVKPGGKTLSAIVQSLKSRTTIAHNKFHATPGDKIWQEDYYDRIIRTDVEYFFVSEYIKNNPLKAETALQEKEWFELLEIREASEKKNKESNNP